MSVALTKSVKQEVLLLVEGKHKYDYNRLTLYVHPPKAKANLLWAELVTLDLEDYNCPGKKERLAK